MEPGNSNVLRLIKARINDKDPTARIILFGSRARGQAGKNSDWDILILVDQNMINRDAEREYRDILFEIEMETGEAISTFVFSKADWENKYAITPLYQNIRKEGVLL